jgi:hypothetical protein
MRRGIGKRDRRAPAVLCSTCCRTTPSEDSRKTSSEHKHCSQSQRAKTTLSAESDTRVDTRVDTRIDARVRAPSWDAVRPT